MFFAILSIMPSASLRFGHAQAATSQVSCVSLITINFEKKSLYSSSNYYYTYKHNSSFTTFECARVRSCRNEYDQMIFDVGIYGGNDDIPTLPCRYACVGCKETKIPLPEIANHEAKCEHVQMRCRYARYGCNWTGKRGLIKAHEQFGCKVAPMGPFVEQYRQTAMRLEMTTQQLAANSRFLHLLRSSYARDNQRKSLMDIFRLIQYCYTVTTLTPVSNHLVGIAIAISMNRMR